jgi:hypothetical protein
MPSAAESYVWVWVDASYLREQAQRCSRAARDCPHLATSHELEAMGTEWMQKATELEQLQLIDRPNSPAVKAVSEVKSPKKSS